MDTDNMSRWQEQNGLRHIVRLANDAEWEVINEFKRDGGKRYCYLKKSQFKYEYYWYFSNNRDVFAWLLDNKGPKMPRWLVHNDIYQEIKFKTLDYKQDFHGKRLYIRNPDNYEDLKNG